MTVLRASISKPEGKSNAYIGAREFTRDSEFQAVLVDIESLQQRQRFAELRN